MSNKQELKGSEIKYRMLFESANDAIFLMDNDIFIDCNEKTLEMFACTREQIIGQPPYYFSPKYQPDGRKSKEKALEKINDALKGNSKPFEWIHTKYDRTEFNAEVSLNIFEFHNKNIILAIVRDITKRKKAEIALKESEEKYRMLFESANDAIFLMDNDIFIDCNEKTLEMFACTREQIIGQPPYYFSPKYQPDGRKSKEKALEKINDALKGNPKIFEWIHTKYDGTEFYAEVNLNIFELQNKNVIQAIVRDITKRKRIENEIKLSEDKFKNIFNSSSDTIIILDIEGKVITVNNSLIKNLGYQPEELIGDKIIKYVSNQNIDEVKNRILLMGKGKNVPLKELEMISKKGELVPFEVNSKLIDYEGKKAILSVIRNIKERKELEQKIYDTIIETEEKERQRLARDIHDEIGPLLSSLKMYIESLNEKNAAKKQKYLKKQLQNLIKESIINVREVSNALSPYLLGKYGLNTAINSFLENSKHLLKISYETNLKKERFQINIETVYYRIIKELFNNTIKHSGAENVLISLKYLNKKLILIYEDDGIGMKNTDLEIFEKKGMGLFNIKNRIISINGKYEFTLKKNEGFKFELLKEVEKLNK